MPRRDPLMMSEACRAAFNAYALRERSELPSKAFLAGWNAHKLAYLRLASGLDPITGRPQPRRAPRNPDTEPHKAAVVRSQPLKPR